MSVTSFFHTILSSKLFIQIVIIEIIATLATGLLLGWFFGMLGTFAGGAFQWHTDAMLAGLIFGVAMIGPAINAVFLLFTRHFKGALIALLIAVAGFLVCFRLIPYIQDQQKAKLDAAPAEVIAQRAIDKVKREEKYDGTANYIFWVDFELINECLRLEPAKTKDVVDCTAKLIAEDESLSPQVTEYGWRTTYYNSKPFRITMVLYLEDGSYGELRYLDAKDWEQLELETPPALESTH